MNKPRGSIFDIKTARRHPIPAKLSIKRWSEQWEQVPIITGNSKDPLVSIGPLSEYPQLKTNSIYAGEYANSPYTGGLDGSLLSVYVRRSVAERLTLAQSFLPEHLSLVIFDGYRTLALQRKLFDAYFEALRQRNPGCPQTELLKETQTFVSHPSIDPSRPSPHATGGAVDMAIVSSSDSMQTMLNFGTPFDHGGNKAYLRYFEELQDQRSLTPPEQEALENRRVLYQLMTAVGMQGFPAEWWHFNAPETQMGAYAAGLDYALFSAATFSSEQQACEQRRRKLAGQLGKPTRLPKAATMQPVNTIT